MRTFRNVLVDMNDGVQLAVDVYLPQRQGRFPAVLYMGPYRKEDWILHHGSVGRLPEIYTSQDYALVVADVRGTGNSEGIARVMFHIREQQDGAELVEWVAAQPWCDSNVGMTGLSYGFFTSLLTAAQNPPHLRAVVPIHAGVSWFYAIHESGVPMSFGYHANYVALMISMNGAPPGIRDQEGRWQQIWKHRLEHHTPWGLEWFGEQADNEYWRMGSVSEVYDRIRVPVFTIDGWWDRYASDPVKLFENLSGPTQLLLGPWQHTRPDTGVPGPRVDYEIIVRWFDRWLKTEKKESAADPRVTYFAQRYGTPADYRQSIPGEWLSRESWPIPGSQKLTWYLAGDGTLAPQRPQAESHGEYRYDPTAGSCCRLDGGIFGGIGMPADQRCDDAKALLFTGPVCSEEIEVTGIPRVRVFFSSEARVMGVFARLCDLAPDGTVALVTRGHLNACHRDGLNRPRFLEPHEVYPIDIEMKATSYVFEPGHRIRLMISSAEFPSFFPTPMPGTNRVCAGGERASFLELPVVPASAPRLTPQVRELAPPSAQAPEGLTFTIEEDPQSGEWKAVLESDTRFEGLKYWVRHRHVTSARVHPERPAEAVVESTSLFRLEYNSGEVIDSTGSVVCAGSETKIDISAELQVTVDGRVEFQRSWRREYPRGYF